MNFFKVNKFKLRMALTMILIMVSLIIQPIAIWADHDSSPYDNVGNYDELEERSYIEDGEYVGEDYIVIDLEDPDIVDVFEFYYDMELLLQEDEYLHELLLEAQHLMNVQAPAIESYNILMDSFMGSVSGYLQFQYPDHYAGAYMDYDTLVIQITDVNDETIEFYRDILGADAPIRFKEVNFSINQLTTLGEFFLEAIEVPIMSFGYNTLNNSFSITLDPSVSGSAEVVEGFNETARFMPIPISIELGEQVELRSLRGGDALMHQNRPTHSVGLTGFRGTNPALLTAGHSYVGASLNARILNRDGRHIGYLAMARAGNNVSIGGPTTANGDWAIISLNSTGASMATNVMRNGSRITGMSSNAPVNAVVRGTGQHTMNWMGTVTAVNQRINFDVVGYMGGITRVAYTGNPRTVGGDSGGTIFMASGNNFNMVGTLTGATNTHWYFSPMSWPIQFRPIMN